MEEHIKDEALGFPGCHLKLENLGKLAFRAVDSDFPGLEGLGTDWRLAVCALADKIEASIKDGEDVARERSILKYAEFLRGVGNEPWQPGEEREIDQ
jgi:hypothetical protein